MAQTMSLDNPGRVAQLVEQRIENPRVGGSIPPPATIWCFGLINNQYITANAQANMLQQFLLVNVFGQVLPH